MNYKIRYINKSNKIHNCKYDYSLVNYKNAKAKVKIICPEHGIFEQSMNNHSNGQGCPKCKNKNTSKRQLSNNYEFIKKSNIIHNFKYDYSLVDYKNAKTKVKIICPEHGIFEQKPNNHLSGHKCYKCSKNLKTEDFIKKSNKKHNCKYDYSLVDYKDGNTFIKIICKNHGIFEQRPKYHLKCKNACKICQLNDNRIKTINRISKNRLYGKQLYPNFNEKACLIFDKISKEKNIKIQHAKNGGEFFIKELGYWVDGYDKENNIVYEFDENQHFDKNGELKIKDRIRQKNIINHLKCNFIRIK